MQKVILPNGLTVIFEHKKGNAVVVQVMIKIGSNHEKNTERGISHFLEHILFEGTVKRPTNQIISNEIESVGGDLNAYTTNERTCFYVKVLKKHFPKAIEVLADILQNSLFKTEHIEKEKKIVLKEIDMIYDEPRFYQWIILQQNLFQTHPCRNPTYGNKKSVQTLTRKKVVNYFKRYYTPKNMVLSVVGDINHWKKLTLEHFTMPSKDFIPLKITGELAKNRIIIKKEKKNIANTYVVLGFKTIPRSHPDTYILEVINGILGRGQSGKIFIKIRTEKSLAYDVGTQNIGEVSFGYFAVYASVDKKNIKLVRKLILQEIEKLKKITEKEVKEAQEYIEGGYFLELEDAQKIADQLLYWEQVKSAQAMKDYIHHIKDVTVQDVKRVIDTYFKYYTMVVLEGKSN